MSIQPSAPAKEHEPASAGSLSETETVAALEALTGRRAWCARGPDGMLDVEIRLDACRQLSAGLGPGNAVEAAVYDEHTGIASDLPVQTVAELVDAVAALVRESA